MKETMAKSLSDTAYVASGMLVCGLVFSILNGEYLLTKQNSLYFLAILVSYFVVNLVLQQITKTKKARDTNANP